VLGFATGADSRRNECVRRRPLLPSVFLSTIAAAALFFVLVSAPATHAQDRTAPVAKKPATTSSSTSSSSPTEDTQLYRNTAFGFRYKVPYGWVDRTKEMQEGNDAGKSEAGKAQVLLAAFERPPDAIGDTVNSAVVIASESTASYPGLKKAEDYLGPVTELATAKGFKAEGEPYALEVESRQLLRADFSKDLEVKTTEVNTSNKLTMRQCTLVLLAKGQIISFTFIASSEDELDDLMDGLHFGGAKSPVH